MKEAGFGDGPLGLMTSSLAASDPVGRGCPQASLDWCPCEAQPGCGLELGARPGHGGPHRQLQVVQARPQEALPGPSLQQEVLLPEALGLSHDGPLA